MSQLTCTIHDFLTLTKTEQEQSLHFVSSFAEPFSTLYPLFEEWFERIEKEFYSKNQDRVFLIAKEGEAIVGFSILKKSENKLCTIFIDPYYRGIGFGSQLLLESVRILDQTKPILVTTDHSMFLTMKDFFDKFNFIPVYWEKNNKKIEHFFNRHNEEHSLNKDKTSALLSIKPIFSQAITGGRKHVEFRKQDFKESVEYIFVYESLPIKKIVGFFELEEIESLSPSDAFARYEKVGGIRAEDFNDYYKNKKEAFVLKIKRYYAFPEAVDPYNSSLFEGKFTPPQSFRYLTKEQTEFLMTTYENQLSKLTVLI